MEQHTTLRETFRRYQEGLLSEDETKAFLEQIKSGRDRESVQELIQEALHDPIDQNRLNDRELWAVLDMSWTNLQIRIDQKRQKKILPRRLITGIAATFLCILSIGIGFYLQESSSDSSTTAQQETIVPGQQTATLTLADGRKIKLSEASNGELAEDANVRISKSADGQLIYEIQENQTNTSAYNTLSTARGETYKVHLPDGTQVWLNAASSIRYATNFSAHAIRKVELDGEAYFEVSKDAKRPFVVHTGRQEVKVLGTRFNINSYTDESTISTTLLEGTVEINRENNKTALRPGQQAILSSSGRLQVREVDTEPIISWTNNEFMFDGDDIDVVMRKIERWYNVKVVYQGAKTAEKFGGGLSRFEQVGQVLQLLEKTGAVKFRVEGKTIYVL